MRAARRLRNGLARDAPATYNHYTPLASTRSVSTPGNCLANPTASRDPAPERTKIYAKTKMIRTRIFVGLTVLVLTALPLFVLSNLTYGYRYGIITGIYNRADAVFPTLATFLWPFGPLDWWGYITPVACAIGVGASLRSPIRLGALLGMLIFSLVQAVLIFAGFQPYAKLGSVMGYPAPAPYPVVPLLINLAMVASAIIFAVLSMVRCAAVRRQLTKTV